MRKLNKSAVLVSTFLALAAHQINGQAQAADSGTINISGQISASTCLLNMSDTSGTVNGGTKTVNLGTMSSSSVGTGTAGSTFGTAQTVTFSVKAADGTTNCTLGSGNSAWDIALALGNSQIATIGSATVLKNSLTTNATDAAVILKGGFNTTTPGTTLALKGDLGIGGTLMSGLATPTATAGQNIVMSAQFVRSSASAPTSGAYSATIPLLVVYK